MWRPALLIIIRTTAPRLGFAFTCDGWLSRPAGMFPAGRRSSVPSYRSATVSDSHGIPRYSVQGTTGRGKSQAGRMPGLGPRRISGYALDMNTSFDVDVRSGTGKRPEIPAGLNAEVSAEAAALLRRGVLLPARGGDAVSLGRFLTLGLGLEEAYVESRIQTILRNGLAVDDFAVPLASGDRLALSAAMPGVAGAALRRGGRYAAMRAAITQRREDAPPASEARLEAPVWIELRCFNSIAEELAGHLLCRGLAARPADAGQVLLPLAATPPAGLALPEPDLLWLAA